MTPDPDPADTASPVVVVEKVVPAGHGFARLHSGLPVFVPGAFPQDRVRLDTLSREKSFARADAWTLLEAGPDRVEPECPFFEACGGCDWMPLRPDAAARAKVALLHEALTRIARLRPLPVDVQWVESPALLRYRTRVRLHVGADGRVGYYRVGSEEIVPVTSCAVSVPVIEEVLRQVVEASLVTPALFSTLAHVTLVSANGERASVHLAAREPSMSDTSSLRQWFREHCPDVSVSFEGERGEPERIQLRGAVYTYVAPGAFSQVNPAVNESLIERICAGAKQRGVTSFADLYAGSGNFSLPLLADGLLGDAVELDARAIAAARRAATEQGFEAKSFQRGDAVQVARRWAKQQRRYELVLIDPPRSGMKHGLDSVARLTNRIALISCDPATLARDLRTLLDRGFVVEALIGFDMFPQTHHVETLVWLRRT